MNYELAKKLKDAGFPQSDDIEDITCECGITGCEIHDYEKAYIPTLSELIEACGDKILGIVRANELNEWCAIGVGYPLGKIEGNTPKEAVANLWLEIKK